MEKTVLTSLRVKQVTLEQWRKAAPTAGKTLTAFICDAVNSRQPSVSPQMPQVSWTVSTPHFSVSEGQRTWSENPLSAHTNWDIVRN